MGMRPKLLFFVTEDWYFCSHRLQLAIAAKQAGYEVAVLTRVRDHGNIIKSAGIRLIPFESQRRSLNPFREIGVLARLVAVYRRELPDVVHHVAVKPVIYGAIAARIAGIGKTVNTLAGLGWFSTSPGITARIFQKLIKLAISNLLSSGMVIVQNPDDRRWLIGSGVPEEKIRLIRGSGVDTEVFTPGHRTNEVPVVVLVARMLWDKGVGQFVEAAHIIRSRGETARFVLIGSPDPENPSSISELQLKAWSDEGVVEWWGHRNDLPSILKCVDIACLPSYYREGVPKSLLEAAAAGLPIVTTDAPGCREIVENGVNGLLVPPQNVSRLVEALIYLLDDRDTRRKMGNEGRRLAEAEFSIGQVVYETLAVYRSPQ